MENKTITESELGPEIILDVNGTISISGRSMMEDPSEFYAEVHSWIKEYLNTGNKSLSVSFELIYFNSSSSKQILRLLMIIDDAEIEAKVTWNYPGDNEFLMERGEEFAIMLDLPFEYLAK